MIQHVHRSTRSKWAFKIMRLDSVCYILFVSNASFTIARATPEHIVSLQTVDFSAQIRGAEWTSTSEVQSDASVLGYLVVTDVKGYCHILSIKQKQLQEFEAESACTIRIDMLRLLNNDEQLGKSISSSINTRTLAISAWTNSILLMQPNYQENKLSAFLDLNLQGTILYTTFLYPQAKMKESDILAVLFLDTKATPRIALFVWSQGFCASTSTSYSQYTIPVPNDFSLCSHFVSCPNIPEHFIVVLETRMCLLSVSQIECGDLQFLSEDLPQVEDDALVVAFEPDLSSTNVYLLAFDNGDIFRVRTSVVSIDYLYCGKINNPATSPLVPLSPYLLATGDGCDGGFYEIQGDKVSLLYDIPCWAPVWDFVCLKARNGTVLNGDLTQSSIVTASGIGKSGALYQLRYGKRLYPVLEATLTFGATLMRMFQASEDESYCWLNYPWQTQILKVSQDGAVEDVTDELHFEVSTSLLVLCFSGIFIQITKNAIHRCCFGEQPFAILQAAQDSEFVISFSSPSSLFIVEQKEGGSSVGKILSLKRNDSLHCSLTDVTIPIFAEVLCGCIISMNNTEIVVTGTADSHLSFHSITTEGVRLINKFQLHEDGSVHEIVENDVFLPISVSYLRETENEATVLTSTKNGYLVCFRVIMIDMTNVQVNFVSRERFQTLPLMLQANMGEQSSLYAWQGSIYSITKNRKADDSSFLSIIPVIGPETLQNIHGVCPFSPFPDSLGQQMIAFFSQDSLYVSEVQVQEDTIARRFPVSATPRRLLHDKFTNTLVVGCCHIPILNAETSDLYFCDANTFENVSKPWPSTDLKGKTIFKPGETIYSMCFWTVRGINHKKYRHLCIGTGLEKSKNGNGRVLILTLSKPDDHPTIDIRHVITVYTEQPVLSICPVGEYALCYSAGKTLGLKVLDVVQKKFSNGDCTLNLRSMAVSLCSYKNYIFATTVRDSVCVVEYIPETNVLKLVSTDTVPRMGVDSYYLSQTDTLFGCDKLNVLTVYDCNMKPKDDRLKSLGLQVVLQQERQLCTLTNKLKYTVLMKSSKGEAQWGILAGTISGDIYKLFIK
ncbi:E3 ubiquitin ligase complex subunit Mms1 [Schizosaccharomyces japonicus yFS275]|uniref:E3 ubiquitin ligase complex subunit Mms1 n=1 Tax=Schizosaccharomyces japonicus (strain yFS275 / FY16936) TaxID=402676 RepID=B6K2T0_SCHJY|nr:E3 ubiquitin ligase complex subunit Mms1 [Schizosaccharomyces japonicus yFS275]EEB08570.2 E3 ubiquitin ligase complex subunit Mms1 [Schizosaccharomyces japonicus yFS275]